MLRIATEEAFATPTMIRQMDAVTRGLWENLDATFWRRMIDAAAAGDPRIDGLLDIGAGRIADMDANGVTMQLLSLTSPGVQIFDAETAAAVAEDANDLLAEAIAVHPGRFGGLAALAPQDPPRAAKEMERAIKSLGLNGFIINSHTGGRYLDEPDFWPILEAAEALDRPIYIHPRTLPDAAIGPYRDHNLWTAMWGYAAETGLHGMRLIASGVFDRFPGLKIALGHMGEGIPYWAYRIDYMYDVTSRRLPNKLAMKPTDYLKRNMLITTSGMNHHPALDYCLKVVGPDNILWAIDYPYQMSAEAVAFLDSAEIGEDVRAQIYAGNAIREFRLKVTA